MKKNLFNFFLLISMLGGNAFAQAIVSGNPNSVTAGSSISMVLTGVNTNFLAATGAYIYNPGLNAVFYPATSFSPSSNTVMTVNYSLPPNAPLGNYTVGVYGPTDLANGLSVSIGPGSAYGQISGYVNYDYNNNCVIDPGEGGLANRIVGINGQYVTTDPNGYYSLWVPFGTYNLSSSAPLYHFFPCPNPPAVTVNTSLGQYTNNNFYLDTISVSDLAVTITGGIWRPGFTVWEAVQVKNIANTISSPTTGYLVSPVSLYTSYNFTPGATSVNGDTAFFNVPPIAPGNTFTFWLNGTLSPSVNLGSPISFYTNIDPALSEATASNNQASGVAVVQGSYDPNDKQVWDLDDNVADGFIDPSDTVLRYLIRFQNTGTDTAFNIYIRDTLDPNLDISTLNVDRASHNWNMTITDTGSVQWNFPNILLLDSFANEPLSHGYIGYTIKLKPGLPIGTQIDNGAGIYFDFNAPVATNVVSSIICPEILPSYTSSTSGNTANFTATSGTAVSAWLWDFGDGNTSTQQNPSHTYTNGGLYNICLYASNSCGRTDSVCQTIAVNCPAPTSAFSSTVSNATATFTDLSTGGPTSWLWDFGDGNTSTLANPTHTYAVPGTYTVCLTSNSACGTDSSCQTVTVVCAAPVSAFISNVSGATASFTDQSTFSPTGWYWTFGDGGNSLLQNPSHTYTIAGSYTVCLVATSVCGSDTSCSTVTTACATPTASFSAQQSNSTISLNDQSNNSPTSWLWTFGDGSSSTQQNPSHTYTSTGTYTICLVATNACGSDTNCITVGVIVGLEDALLNRFDLYPNPAHDRFLVDMELKDEALVGFRLYNAVGSLLRTEPEALLRGEVRKTFELEQLPAGMYLLEMRVDGQSLTWKVVKE